MEEHDMVRSVDPNGETLVWCRNNSVCARSRLGPKLMNRFKREKNDTKEHGYMLKRNLNLEERSQTGKLKGGNWMEKTGGCSSHFVFFCDCVFCVPIKVPANLPLVVLLSVWTAAVSSRDRWPFARRRMANAEKEGLDGRSGADGRASCQGCHH